MKLSCKWFRFATNFEDRLIVMRGKLKTRVNFSAGNSGTRLGTSEPHDICGKIRRRVAARDTAVGER